MMYITAATSTDCSGVAEELARDLGPPEQLLDEDDEAERRVLEQGDELADDGRDHPPEGLGHDHQQHRLPVPEADG